MQRELHDLVRQRANNACEYCKLPENLHPLPFQIDHIIAQQHGGPSEAENLCWACFRCNSHKGPNLSGFSWESREIVRLFNPRQDDWDEHFQWDGPSLRGRTKIGDVTITVLTMNAPSYVALRESLIAEGLFPPNK